MKRILITLLLQLLRFVALSVAQQTTTPLNDSQIYTSTISSGGLQHYYFSASTLQKRLASAFQPHLDNRAPSIAYLSLTSCSQPTAPSGYEGEVPSLDMYISTSSSNTLPGPNQGQMTNDSYPGRLSWQGEISELWIGVVAPTLTDDWQGTWTFQIAISTQQFVHPLLLDQNNGNIPYMMLDDTDQTHALFLTKGGQQNASVLVTRDIPRELKYSLCAAENYRVPNYSLNITQTTRGPPGSTWQQVEAANLTSGTTYTAYYLQSVGSFTGVSAPIDFSTKIDGNCRLIYGLSFCDQVAYSVPADASLDINAVKDGYDSQAQALFEPFNVAISQFNCETTRYSLVRNCTDCYNDYKRWLCAVTIPRCTSTISGIEDNIPQQSSTATAARALRAVNVNESRNPWIDENMNPGGWIELLPCIDLCYFVVQSCPPFMQFNCPTGDLAKLQYGYWRNMTVESNGMDIQFGTNLPTCNRVDVNETRLVLGEASSTLQTHLSFISTIITTLVIISSYW